jgi:four helix bundle protein
MDQEILKARTKEFGLRVMKLVDEMPNTMVGRTVGSQLIRSATSVGANYRAACRSRSRAEFIAKIGMVVEEADESAFWLELIIDSGLVKDDLVSALHREAEEFTAIFTASGRTAKCNNPQSKISNPKSGVSRA